VAAAGRLGVLVDERADTLTSARRDPAVRGY
jgi:hypothetical protein